MNALGGRSLGAPLRTHPPSGRMRCRSESPVASGEAIETAPSRRQRRSISVPSLESSSSPSGSSRVKSPSCPMCSRSSAQDEKIGPGVNSQLSTVERVAALHRVDLFAGVPGCVLAAVAETATEVRASPGALLIEEGAVEEHLFAIVEGLVRVHHGTQRSSSSGRASRSASSPCSNQSPARHR